MKPGWPASGGSGSASSATSPTSPRLSDWPSLASAGADDQARTARPVSWRGLPSRVSGRRRLHRRQRDHDQQHMGRDAQPQSLADQARGAHSWQYLYCLGLPSTSAYVIFMGWSVIRTGDRAARNFFERQAGLSIGGYVDYPVRPIGDRPPRRIWSAETQSIVRSMPSRLAERLRCRVARSRRSRLTSSGSWASASGLSIRAFSTW